MQRPTAGPAFYDSLAVALAFGFALTAIGHVSGTHVNPAVTLALAATPAENVGDLWALVVEILVTFILVYVMICVVTDDRASAGVAPLAVGFTLACSVFIAGPITGGSLNPARTLGPMILAGNFNAVWVYIVGAMLAALIYHRFASQANATG